MWLATNNKQQDEMNAMFWLAGQVCITDLSCLLRIFGKNLESFLFLLADRHVLLLRLGFYKDTFFLGVY